MATTASGGVVMFGGYSVTDPGERLGDTLQLSSNNQTWTEPVLSAVPPPTGGAAMASTMIGSTPAYFLFGGDTSAGFVAKTWRYNGTGYSDVTSGTAPAARSQHAMVTNTTTGTIFLFGGWDGVQAMNDTWELTPATNTWTARSVPGTKPSVRRGHCMAYHPTTDRTYVFGGSPFLNDLWAFDASSNTWAQITPASPLPPGRRFASMSYLEGSGTLILFGGLSAGGVIRNDSWSYDPLTNQWIQVGVNNPPPPRWRHATTPDNTGDNLVLLGGSNALPPSQVGTVLEGTWLFSSITSEWSLEIPSPSSRDGIAMAYDSVRNRHVMFGGRTVPVSAPVDETWELQGLNWRERTPSTRPSPRSDAGAVFDVLRNVTVLYGGRLAGGQELGDTWEWNGAVWTPRTFAMSPPPAGGTQPVFDSLRNRVCVLVGSTMWTYDGFAWTLWTPQVPPARTQFGAAFDRVRNRLVVFGGDTAQATAANDTWEWNGSAWTQIVPATTPLGRRDFAMTYDVVRQVCVLVGGDATAPTFFGDAWSWNGLNWAQIAPITIPRHGSAIAHDPVRARTLLHGGASNVTDYHSDVTEWDGSIWQGPQSTPIARTWASAAFDSVRNVAVFFGGYGPGTAPTNDTWEYDGVTWVQRFPPTSPPARGFAAMSFDSSSGTTLLFGGGTGFVDFGDTWAWNGTTWTQLFPGTSPVSRRFSVLVDTGSRPLLFGGHTAFGATGTHNDLWQWTGSTWVNLGPFIPTARTNYGAAYDARRDRVVVFGGMTSNDRTTATYNSETWEWDGTAWLRRLPVSTPPARGWCKLTYDEHRSRVVLYGGADASNVFQDTWEWDGTNWLQRNPTANPPGSYGHDLTFDRDRRLAIAFGGLGTWDYGAVNPAAITTYGAGCPSSSSVPATAAFALKLRPWTGAWLGEMFEMEFANTPLGIGAFVWGFDYQNSQLGPLPISLGLLGLGPNNCYLRNSFDLLEVFLGATYTSPIFVNITTSLLGTRVYGQAAYFDAGLPGTQVVATEGAEFVIGQK